VLGRCALVLTCTWKTFIIKVNLLFAAEVILLSIAIPDRNQCNNSILKEIHSVDIGTKAASLAICEISGKLCKLSNRCPTTYYLQIACTSLTYNSIHSVVCFSQLISYAWFNLTGNNASRAYPRAYPRAFATFSLSWRSIPHPPPPRARRNRPYPTPEMLIDLIFVFWVHLFDSYKSKTRRFHNFQERFPKFIEKRKMDVIM